MARSELAGITVERGLVVWRMPADEAEFYATEFERFAGSDVGVREDQRALYEAVERLRPEEVSDGGD